VLRSKTEQVSPERWQEVKAIVAEALEEESRAERARLIARLCGSDAALLREVESLLAQTTGTLENFVEKSSAPLRRIPARSLV